MIIHGVKNAKLISQEISRRCGKNRPYVEIGIFKGEHLIYQALQNPKILCIGIDNFSLFDLNKQNLKEIIKKIKNKNIKNIKIIKSDFEIAQNLTVFSKKKKGGGGGEGIKKIGVLFVDAAHDYRSQLVALLKYEKLLHRNGSIVIDDANYFHVRQATKDFLDTHKNFSLIFQKYTKLHIANSKRKDLLLKGHFNGIHVLSKNNYKSLKVKFPKNKKLLMNLFVQSHEIFRHYFAFHAHKIIDLVYDFKINKNKKFFLKQILNIKNKAPISNHIKYRSQNIF